MPQLFSGNPEKFVTPETIETYRDMNSWLNRSIWISASKKACLDDEPRLLDIVARYEEGMTSLEFFQIQTALSSEVLFIADNILLLLLHNSLAQVVFAIIDAGMLPFPTVSKELFNKTNREYIKAACRNKTDEIDAICDKYDANFPTSITAVNTILGI